MDEEGKRRMAQFRFGVIHDLIGDRKLKRGERKKLLLEKSSCMWDIPALSGVSSAPRRFSVGFESMRRKTLRGCGP